MHSSRHHFTARLAGALLIALAWVLCPVCGAGESQQQAETPALTVAPPEPAVDFEIPAIVARVEDETITDAEFRNALRSVAEMQRARMMQFSQEGAGAPPAMPPIGLKEAHELANRMLQAEIVYVMAKKAGVKADAEEVEKEFAEMKEQVDPDRFREHLEREKITEDQFKERVAKRMVIMKYLEDRTKDLKVTDDELNETYEQLRQAGRLDRPATADVAHVLIQVDEGADEAGWDAAKTRIDAAHKRVVDGEDFAAVAQEVSEDPGSKDKGGLYEDVPKGAMVPEFDKLTFETPLGEVTAPFRTRFGWHFLKVSERTEAATMTHEEVDDDIREFLLNRKRGEAEQKIVQEGRDTLKVEVLLPALEEAAPGDVLVLPTDPS